MIKYIEVMGLLALYAAFAAAQNPGQHVQIDLGVASITTAVDTTGISYSVTNLSTSTEPLWVFHVDAPGGVLRVAPSTSGLQWRTRTSSAGQPMAGWSFKPSYLAPGASAPELHFDAVGLPGIRTYWAGGYYPLPDASDNLVTDSTVLPDPFVARMVNGKTVSVDPWPTDRSAQALLARLRTLTQNSCATPTIWITDTVLCGQLVGDLDQAESFRGAGQFSQAKDAIATFNSRLAAGSASGTVKSSAFWLLKVNASIISAMW
jgi:hypothetical protein